MAELKSDTMEQDRVNTPTHPRSAVDEHHHGITRLTRARLLNHQEEMDLARKVKQGGSEGRRAQHRLVESNMRLVVSIAKAYRASGIPIEDLVQEGAIGLMTAAERYDPDRGFRFSTYATQWIRQAIGRAVDNKAKAIRLPAHVSESLRKLDRVRAELRRETGDEPTNENIAERSGLSVRKVQALLNTTQDPISLDLPVGDEENTSLGSLLTDRNAPDPQSTLLDVEMVREVDNILNSLDERERRVMRLRYGFDGDDALVLAQIGEQLNISRERVRQIEQHALKKLRNEAKKGRLREIV